MTVNTVKPVDTLSVLNSITANTPDLIYAFDLNYRFTYANPALLTMWGKSWDEAIGKSLLENGYELWHAEMHEREIDQVVATRKPIRGEVSFPHAILGSRIYDYIFVPVLNDQGEVEAIAGTTRDITEIKKTEEALRSSERQHAFLLRLNDHLRAFTDPAEIQHQAASLLGSFLHANRAGYAEDVGDGKSVRVTTDYTNGVPSIKGQFQYDDYGPELLEAFKVGNTVVRSNIAADPSLSDDEKEAHAALQLGATLNVPLLRSSQLIAIFFVHHRNPHKWTDEEVHMVQNVAERTWDAVIRARAEVALRESEERFRTMVNAVPQSIWITDAEGRTEFLNQHWCDYSGVPYTPTTASEIAMHYVHPDDAPVLMQVFNKAMQTGEPFEVEQRNRSKTGEYRWFLNRAWPYYDPATGRITKWFGVGVDIHDRKLAEQALRASEEQLERKVKERTTELGNSNLELKRSNKNLEEFAYAASHDLKEPIRKIHFFANRLKESLGEKMQEAEKLYFERMELAARRMNTLIDDLLMYSEVSQSAIPLETVNISELLDQALTDLDLEIEQKGAVIEAGELFTIKGYRRQLQQVFYNLLTNGLKYSKPSGTPNIKIESTRVKGYDTGLDLSPDEQAQEYHMVTVFDNGIGFDQQNAERIFNVFTRLHGNAEYKGTGVGLSIVRKVMENHRGHIWAESSPGEGAKFYLLFPVE